MPWDTISLLTVKKEIFKKESIFIVKKNLFEYFVGCRAQVNVSEVRASVISDHSSWWTRNTTTPSLQSKQSSFEDEIKNKFCDWRRAYQRSGRSGKFSCSFKQLVISSSMAGNNFRESIQHQYFYIGFYIDNFSVYFNL